MHYDPKLKLAMEELKGVLAKHDIAGSFIVVSKTHSDYCLHFPKWSIVRFEGEELKFTNRCGFFSKQDKIRVINQSINILEATNRLSASFFDVTERLLEKLRGRFGYYFKQDHTPHWKQ